MNDNHFQQYMTQLCVFFRMKRHDPVDPEVDSEK